MEYSNDIMEQVIVYESGDYVVCHPHSFPSYIHIYRLCTYKPALRSNTTMSWLCCGTWYLRNDGKYHDSSNAYGIGLGVADSIDQIVEKIKESRRCLEKTKQ